MQFTTSGNKELIAKQEDSVRVYSMRLLLPSYVYIVSNVINKSLQKKLDLLTLQNIFPLMPDLWGYWPDVQRSEIGQNSKGLTNGFLHIPYIPTSTTVWVHLWCFGTHFLLVFPLYWLICLINHNWFPELVPNTGGEQKKQMATRYVMFRKVPAVEKR